MQLKRTLITVKFPHRIEKRTWLSNWGQWWTDIGFSWVEHVGAPKKKNRNPEIDRQRFLNTVNELKNQLYTQDTIDAFKKNKLVLPSNFVIDNIMRLGVGKDEPEELCIAGYGDPASLIAWLKASKYDYTVRNTY